MKRPVNIILLLLFVTTAIHAQQDSLSRDVDIVRSYTPAIKDAGKISTLPSVEKPEVIDAKDIKYSTWSSPLSTRFDLQTLPSATLKRMRAVKDYRQGYAKVGVGNYTSFLGDFYVPVLKAKDYRLDFTANHLSTFGKVKLDDDNKVRARNMKNEAQLTFTKNFFNFDLNSGVKFARRDFNYYGLDSIFSDALYQFPDLTQVSGSEFELDREAHTMLDIYMGLASRPKLGGINYDVSITYELTSARSNLTENHIETKGFLSTNWDQDEVGINLAMDNMFYNNPSANGFLYSALDNQTKSHTVLSFMPYYMLKRDNFNMKIGLKTFFSINKGKAVTASPDIIGQVGLVRDISYLYWGLTGDLKINTMRSIFDENQYFRPDAHIENTHTPLDAYAGVKVKLFDYLVFNGFVGYKFINNQYFFVNHRIGSGDYYDNSFDFVIDEAGLFNVGASLTYNWGQRLSALLKGQFNNWNLTDMDKAWHKPNWELDFDLTYKINDDIKVAVNAFAKGKSYAPGFNGEAVKLKPIVDFSLSGVYEYSSQWAFFLNLNNILAQNRQMWYGYNMHRFNAMAGAIMSF